LANSLLIKLPSLFTSDGGDDWHCCCVQSGLLSLFTVCSYRVNDLREVFSRASTSWCMFAMVETLSEEHESSDFIAASKSCLSFVLCVYATGSLSGREDPASQIAAWSTQALQGLKEVDSGLKQLRCHSPRQVGFSALTPA
jgi:hypothetical protein